MKVTLLISLLTASLFSAAAFAAATPVDTAAVDTAAVDTAKKEEVKDEAKAKLDAATPEQKAAVKEKLQARHKPADATAK